MSGAQASVDAGADAVMVTGTDSFRRGLDKFMEDKWLLDKVTKQNLHVQRQSTSESQCHEATSREGLSFYACC